MLAKALALAVILVLIAPTMTYAQDYVGDAAKVLEKGKVYVAPGTEGTNSKTTGALQQWLTSDDIIVLVMLPSNAAEGEPIDQIATRLSEALGDQRILGLAVGDDVIGYASAKTMGATTSAAAIEQMNRAAGLSSGNPAKALGTFANYMHGWLSAHPQPQPESPPSSVEDEDGVSVFLWFAGGGFIVAIAAALIWFRTRGARLVPGPVQRQLDQIELIRGQISDPDINTALLQLPTDTARYFRTRHKNKEGDFYVFDARFMEAIAVLEKYIDIQDNPRYYPQDRTRLLADGKEGINDLCATVLKAATDGSIQDLADYNRNTLLLQEHRRLADPDYDFERAIQSEK